MKDFGEHNRTIREKNQVTSRHHQVYGDISCLEGQTSHEYEDLVESMLEWLGSQWAPEIFLEGREKFHKLMGQVSQDERFYQARIAYALTFFLMQTPLASGFTPYEECLRSQNSPWFQKTLSLGTFRHSLFMVHKITRKGYWLKDLFMGENIFVSLDHPWRLYKSDLNIVFQGFAWPDGIVWRLCRGILAHPEGATPWILKAVKKCQFSDQWKLLGILSKRHIEFQRSRLPSLLMYRSLKRD